MKFDLIQDAPQGVRDMAPSRARYVGYADLTDTRSDQYMFFRNMGKNATQGAPLSELETDGTAFGMDASHKFYVVFGG